MNPFAGIRPRPIYYILDENKNPVPATLWEYAAYMKSPANCIVEQTELSEGMVRVSTVFLGIDHAFMSGPPILFETMVFGGPLDEDQRRYCTWTEALEGHNELVAILQPLIGV